MCICIYMQWGASFSSLNSTMAGPNLPPRPASSSSRILLFLTLLLVSLAGFAFVLQWRGGLDDPVTRWSEDHFEFPGMGTISKTRSVNEASSDLGCANLLSQSRNPSFPYSRDWKFDNEPKLKPRICITSSTSAGLEQTLPWIYFHKTIGVSTFYLFVEGKAAAPKASGVLESIPGVKVIYRTKKLEQQQAKSRIWNETWLSSFFYKPCNYELFVKQTLNMEMSIVMAKDAGMDWIIHLDTDELIHPAGTSEYSLRQLLGNISSEVDTVVFPNYESTVERDDIKEPFSEVSLFKMNYDHLPRDVYFGNYKEATRKNPNYFLTYGNGKSAARVRDFLRPNGAHRWHNYMTSPVEIKLEEAAVLHYTYPRLSDLTSRRNRCGCKPTKDDVKRCFMLQFDRDAFIIASSATQEEMLQWYKEHVVWTDSTLKSRLIKRGILRRIHTPMVIIQELREAGLFSSVVAAAHKSQPKEEKKNFFTTSKIKNTQESHAIARSLLETSSISAVPPLYPPVPVDALIIESSNHTASFMRKKISLDRLQEFEI